MSEKVRGERFLPALTPLVLMFLLLLSMPVMAKTGSGSQPKSIRLSKSSVTMITGQSFTLKAAVKPKAAEKAKVTWKSSNKKVAKVSSKGKVSLVGVGKATITASTSNGKKASCRVFSREYSMRCFTAGNLLRVTTPEDTKTYTAYAQMDYGFYYRTFGCVATAVAIVGSGYGKPYTPAQIHEGTADKKYSERYAVTKMGKAAELKSGYGNAAISLRTASQILTNIGIKNRPVYTFSNAKALKQIRAHLKTGKPVIIKKNRNIGMRNPGLGGHHALVIVGLQGKDQAIVIDPGREGVRTDLKLSELVKKDMAPARGNYKNAYVEPAALSAGGYILIDGV